MLDPTNYQSLGQINHYYLANNIYMYMYLTAMDPKPLCIESPWPGVAS